MNVYLDFETASDLDLDVVGAHRYAAHPSTFIHCMGWRRGPMRAVWHPVDGRWPVLLEDALKFGTVYAHNAGFDRLIMQHCVPDSLAKPSFSQWRCTAALARSAGLPGKLAEAAEALQLPMRKGDTRLMKKMADASYTPTGNDRTELAAYCQTDVDLCYAIHQALGDMDEADLLIYRLNEHVNDRGVRIDLASVRALLRLLTAEQARLNGKLPGLTNGAVTKSTQVARLRDWVAGRLGVHLGDLDKHRIEELLQRDELPDDVRTVLEIRRDTAKASTAKFEAMDQQTNQDDERLRGMFMFSGAGQTGRFSSTGVQLHNLTREVPENPDALLATLRQMPAAAVPLVYDDSFISRASTLVRPCLVPAEGKVFISADYAGVEARGLPWLAGEKSEVAAYRAGTDRYLDDAVSVFGGTREDVTPQQRQVGKVVRLACGFGGGGNALMAMAKDYRLKLAQVDADIIAMAWHEANPWAKAFGRTLWDAALATVQVAHDTPVRAGTTDVYYARSMVNGIEVLLCRLPSGRVLHYHDVVFGRDSIESRRPRFTGHMPLWYGLLAENVTQATCNDLLRYGMVVLQGAGLPLVAHVHDEFVIETAERGVDVKSLLEQLPPWAKGFPLSVNPFIAMRYGK